MKEMVRRGHDVVWPPDENGEADLRRLAGCDLIHVFRRSDVHTRSVLAALLRDGMPFTFDNDDDFTALPREAPNYKSSGGLAGQRIFTATVKVARAARWFSTTNEVLAKKYREADVKRVEVIGNYLVRDALRPRHPHNGIVVGWIAGLDHLADVARIDIIDALRRVLAKHKHVQVECIGVDLRLPERYRHDPHVPFEELPGRIGGFDVGIAPLADIPFNRARSDIKLKEYAASGVPWLASPVGPYLGLGEQEGGVLVPDDRWVDALDRLVTNDGDRERLGLAAKSWAETQTLDAVADRWEALFTEAAGRVRRRVVVRRQGGPVRTKPVAR